MINIKKLHIANANMTIFSVNIYRYDSCHNRVKYEIIKCALCNTQIIKYANLTINSVLIF